MLKKGVGTVYYLSVGQYHSHFSACYVFYRKRVKTLALTLTESFNPRILNQTDSFPKL